jgi:CHAT domain-containing protein
MRLLLLVLLILSSHLLQAQSYISGHATPAIDSLVIKGQRNLILKNSPLAKIQFDSLRNYWLNYTGSAKNDIVFLNQNYAQIKYYWCKQVTKEIDVDFLNTIKKINSVCIKEFTEYHTLTGISHLILAKYYTSNLKDNTTGEKLYNKALASFLQSNPFPKDEYRRAIIGLAYNLNKQKRSQEAATMLTNYLNDSSIEKDTIQLIYAHYTLGFSQFNMSQIRSAKNSFLKCHELAKPYLPANDKTRVNVIRNLGIIYNYLGEGNNALDFQFEALELAISKYGAIDSIPKVEIYYESISNAYKKIERNDLSLTYIDSAIYYANKFNSFDRLDAFLVAKSIVVGSYDEKILLQKEAIKLCQENPSCTRIAAMYHNLGEIYRIKKQYQTSLNYLLKAKELKEQNAAEKWSIASTYTSLANVYHSLGEKENAIQVQKKGVNFLKESYGESSIEYLSNLSTLGSYYTSVDKIGLAKNTLHLCLDEFNDSSISKSHSYRTNTLLFLSDAYHKDSNYVDALNYSREAFQLSQGRQSDVKYRANFQYYHLASAFIDMEKIDSAQLYMRELLAENNLSLDSYSKSNLPEYDLEFSFASFINYLTLDEKINAKNIEDIELKVTIGLDILQKIYSTYIFDSEEFDFQTNARKIIDWSLRNLYANKKSISEEDYFDLLFNCMEADKNIRLQNATVNNEHNFNHVDNSILSEEKRLRQEFKIYLNKLSTTSIEDSLHTVYSEKLFQLELEKDTFISTIKNEYPTYYSQRFNKTIITFEEGLQHISKHQIALVYFYENNDSLYQLIVAPEFRSFDFIDLDSLKASLNTHFNSISNLNENEFAETKREFIRSSHNLYKQLLEKAHNSLPEHLVFLTDGELSYLSFDLLLTDDIQSSYQRLPYLIRSHDIHYMSSATQLQGARAIKHNNLDYVGFAPTYNESSYLTGTFRSDLQELFYNQTEISEASSLFNGTTFLGEQATEANFKNQVTNPSILHLAMHTTLDDYDPLETYLSFTIDTTDTEDGRLYITEIAKMNINSDLVILSACETNRGQNVKGQGLMGIAQAFKQANSQNILYTNWLVDDKSSNDIIESFLSLFKNKVKPSSALRQAKLSYLDKSSSIHSMPIYWAGYNFYGSGFQTSKTSNLIYVLSSIGLLFCLLICYKMIKPQIKLKI